MADPNNIVLHDRRLVLMLICKAANSSVKAAFTEALGLDRRLDLALPTCDAVEAMRLRRAGYRVVSVIRHPLARLASCWRDKVLDPDRFHEPFARKYGDAVRPGMGFAEFADFVCGTPDREADQHFRSMTADLLLFGQTVPELVLRVEWPEWWWLLRCDVYSEARLDIGPEQKRNSTDPAAPWPYTPEIEAAVRVRYETDLRRFGYA